MHEVQRTIYVFRLILDETVFKALIGEVNDKTQQKCKSSFSNRMCFIEVK